MTKINDVPGGFIWEPGQSHVVVDRSKNEYTIFRALPPEFTEAEARALLEANATGLCIMPLPAFEAHGADNVEVGIVKHEYFEEDVVSGVLAFFKLAPGVPIGVTWNGGIAYTATDYEYASKTYLDYLLNPEGICRVTERSADPVHPLNHFGPLLGWKGS